LDTAGNLYLADSANSVIRKVATNGIITTVAGNYNLRDRYSGDGLAATNAGLAVPYGLAVDNSGDLYIADFGNNVIRKVGANGIITTVAGNNNLGAGYSGDGNVATGARLDFPSGVAVDAGGNLYIADSVNNVIREAGANGIITTVAGNYNLGAGYSGDGNVATSATLDYPTGVAVDTTGDLYLADYGNSVIREVIASRNLNIAGGALTLSNATAAAAGSYQVIISGPCGSVTSSVVTLTVLLPPSITIQPTNEIAMQGSNATFSVTAAGTAPLSYQWYQNSSALPGATNPCVTINNVQTGSAGNYSVIIANPAGSVTSSNAQLTVISVFGVTIAGSPSISAVVYDRLASLYTAGYVCTSNGAGMVTFSGLVSGNVPSLAGQMATVYCNFSNSLSAVSALGNGNGTLPFLLPSGQVANQPVNLAFSTLFPSTLNLNDWQFQQSDLGVLPYVLVANEALAGAASLTFSDQSLLLQFSGPVNDPNSFSEWPTNYFGFNNPTSVYLVGDADADMFAFLSIFFQMDLQPDINPVFFWTTNANGQFSTNGEYFGYYYLQTTHLRGTVYGPTTQYLATGGLPDPDPQAWSYGTAAGIVESQPNAVGYVTMRQYATVAANVATIADDGVPFSPANVENGSYSLWGYEHVLNNAGLGSSQAALRDALVGAITNTGYTSGGLYTNYFIPLSSMKVDRRFDGGSVMPRHF
jgi:hypothetical protein